MVRDIAKFITDYYTAPERARPPPDFKDAPEFYVLERVLDEKLTFEEGYKRFIESNFAERLERALKPGRFRETVEPVEGKQRWRRQNPALN